MSAPLPCPLCTVLPPDPVTLSASQLRAYVAEPAVWQGRRSGKWRLVRRLGCHHGPTNEEQHATEAEIVSPWNAWASAEAAAKAERLKLSGERLERWRALFA